MTAADGLDARAQGTMRLSNDAASGQFDLAVGNADLGWLRAHAAADRVTAALTSRVTHERPAIQVRECDGKHRRDPVAR